jgi:HEAT repeat protein
MPRWALLLAGILSLCAHAATPSSDELISRFQAEPVFWKQVDIADEIAREANPRDLSPLVPWLAHDDRHVRGNVAYLFAKMGDPRGFETLVGILGDYSNQRTNHQEGGNWIHVPADVRPARQLVMQIREDRYYAVHLLGKLRDPRAMEVLIPLLDHDENNYNVAWALGEIGDARAIPALIDALSNEDALVRVVAIGALEKLHARQALPQITALFDDDAMPNAGERVTVGTTARKAAASIGNAN